MTDNAIFYKIDSMAVTFIRKNIGKSTNNCTITRRCKIYTVIGFGKEIEKVQMYYKMR
jgi:hypothetical protein